MYFGVDTRQVEHKISVCFLKRTLCRAVYCAPHDCVRELTNPTGRILIEDIVANTWIAKLFSRIIVSFFIGLILYLLYVHFLTPIDCITSPRMTIVTAVVWLSHPATPIPRASANTFSGSISKLTTPPITKLTPGGLWWHFPSKSHVTWTSLCEGLWFFTICCINEYSWARAQHIGSVVPFIGKWWSWCVSNNNIRFIVMRQPHDDCNIVSWDRCSKWRGPQCSTYSIRTKCITESISTVFSARSFARECKNHLFVLQSTFFCVCCVLDRSSKECRFSSHGKYMPHQHDKKPFRDVFRCTSVKIVCMEDCAPKTRPAIWRKLAPFCRSSVPSPIDIVFTLYYVARSGSHHSLCCSIVLILFRYRSTRWIGNAKICSLCFELSKSIEILSYLITRKLVLVLKMLVLPYSP